MTAPGALDADARSAVRSWLDSANLPGSAFPDPESTLRRFSARRLRRAISRRRGYWRSNHRSCGARRDATARAATPRDAIRAGAQSSLECADAARPGGLERAAPRPVRGPGRRLAHEAAHAHLPGAADARRNIPCPRKSAITPTSIYPSITRRPSAGCSGRIIPCCRTISGFPSATTAAVHPSACRDKTFRGPRGNGLPAGRGRTRRRPEQRAWTTNSNWAFSSAPAMRWVRRFPWPMPKIISLACACSTIGRRGTCRPGNTSLWARSWQRISPRPFRPGS